MLSFIHHRWKNNRFPVTKFVKKLDEFLYCLKFWTFYFNILQTTMMMNWSLSTTKWITCHHGCLMWGNRVIVPHSKRQDVLSELHETHARIVRTKTLARSCVWWLNLDIDLEQMCHSCLNVKVRSLNHEHHQSTLGIIQVHHGRDYKYWLCWPNSKTDVSDCCC